jgi:hypothetical protein
LQLSNKIIASLYTPSCEVLVVAILTGGGGGEVGVTDLLQQAMELK